MTGLKLLHTADVHLGREFRGLGIFGEQMRHATRDAYERLLQLAKSENVDLVLVAGDLFDSNEVSKGLVQFAIERAASIAPIPCCILPGTHDCFDRRSVYRNPEFVHPPDNVKLLVDTEQPHLDFPELDLVVYGKPNLSNRGTISPLADLQKLGERRFHVAMVHGSIAGIGAEDDFPMTREQIAQSEMTYVALGHWHSWRDWSSNGVPAIYPGSPESLSFDQDDAGHVALVELQDGVASVSKTRVGRYRWLEERVDAATVRSVEDLVERCRGKCDQNALLRIKVTGLAAAGLVLDPDDAARRLADDFLYVELLDQSQLWVDNLPFDKYPETTVIGQFLRLMERRLQSCETDDDRRIVEQATQVGLALLEGKKI